MSIGDIFFNMRVRAILGSVLFLIMAPGTVAGLIPWWISRWKVQLVSPGFLLVQALGVLVLVTGILFLFETFARFALQGMPSSVLTCLDGYRGSDHGTDLPDTVDSGTQLP